MSFETNQIANSLSEEDFIRKAIEELANARIDEKKLAEKAQGMGRPFFSMEEVEADIRKRNELAHRFAESDSSKENGQEVSDTGHMAEFVFRTAMEKYGWFASKEKVSVIITSLFDDYFRGIDSVIQVVMGDGSFDHLGLALDFTMSADDVEKKLRATFNLLDDGSCPSVKYFDSERTGPVMNYGVPRLVIAANKMVIERLSGLCEEIMFATTESGRSVELLRDDTFKYSVHLQIRLQLVSFIERLEKVAKSAQSKGSGEVVRRANETLARHRKALRTLDTLEASEGISIEKMRLKLRDSIEVFTRMSGILNTLSRMPIK